MSWVGIALIGIFLVVVISDAWPPALLQPQWQQRVSQRILSSAGFSALLGSLLLVSSTLADPDNEKLRRRDRLIRRLAYAAAIGFALLIPLQMSAGVRLLRAEQQQQASTLNQARAAARAVEASTTFAELRQAYERIPGQKPQFPTRLDEPLGEVRDRIMDRINPNIQRIETAFNQSLSQRWQRFWFEYLLRNGLTSLFLFLGFSSIGKMPRSKKTLLQHLLSPGNYSSAWKKNPSAASQLIQKDKKEQLAGSSYPSKRKATNPIKNLFPGKRRKSLIAPEWLEHEENNK